MSVGIRRGPDIRWITQLIGSYHHDRKKLGPAVAQGSLNSLFEEEAYATIRTTPPAMAYQFYLLGEITDRALRRLASKKKYIRNVRGYVDLSTFALFSRVLREEGIQLGREAATRDLEELYEADAPIWERTVKSAVDHTLEAFEKAAGSARRREGKTLTPANFFKNATLVGSLMRSPIPAQMRKIVAEFER